ncbi:RNA polymerase subunit sigma-70 [Dactylosporangium sp. NBC_01737]|uniref:RNA polymerase subunit sigma-70 n=1 Tax=Dactylosporangium sp. NBC_01737 TaxID=2975959 RepID=UPI002E13D8A0|nr:RNA polymerase subunit sigma-70 [Dactylosporangium sp. NBC_01737]
MISGPDLDAHRVALTGYCYRMLGSAFDAEDAVQETMLRAWRAAGRFDERRGSLRTWLFSIATNVCLDVLRAAGRRALAVDLAPAGAPGGDFGAPLPESAFVGPVPDGRVLPAGDPAELAVQRETIRLAFVAALQLLPPKQRAVLILREVLAWSAAEVATLLETSVASVNSALQRARAALPSIPQPRHEGELDQELLDRYVHAFTNHDVDTLVTLLHQDATMSMPPFSWWLSGRDAIGATMRASDACRGDVLLQVRANGGPAFGQYRDGRPFALLLLTGGPLITSSVAFLGRADLFPLFDLPAGLVHAT